MLPSPRTYAFWLALLRIYLGIFWLEHGLGKLRSNPAFGAPGGLMSQFLATNLAKSTGPYHDFLATIVQPNLTAFAFLVQAGEIATGGLLLVGLFTRLGGLLGVFLALNYLVAKGNLTGMSAFTGLDMLAAVASAVNLVLPTGRYLGFDGLLTPRPATSRAVPPHPVQRSAPPPIVTPPPRTS